MGYAQNGYYGSQEITPDLENYIGNVPHNSVDAADGELSEQDVMNVLGIMQNTYNIDTNRTYLMGRSMGGLGAYYLAYKHADTWAAVGTMAPAVMRLDGSVIVGGQLTTAAKYTQPRQEVLTAIKDAAIPVICFQGQDDVLVLPEITESWVQSMWSLGMDITYREVPRLTHGSITLELPQMFNFFSTHAKNDPSEADKAQAINQAQPQRQRPNPPSSPSNTGNGSN